MAMVIVRAFRQVSGEYRQPRIRPVPAPFRKSMIFFSRRSFPYEKGMNLINQLNNVDAVFITNDNQIHYSKNFQHKQ